MDDNDWNVQLLRFTGFIPNYVDYDLKTWWEKIIGEVPDNIITKPKEQITEIHGKYNSGKNEGNLKLISKSNRVDLLYESYLGNRSFDFPTLGIYKDIANHFCEKIVSKLLNDSGDFPDLSRLAFGCIIYQSANELNDAFKMLSNYIKCIDFELVEKNIDFQYNTNRHRIINVKDDDIKINRLMKWYTRVGEVLEINVTENKQKVAKYPIMYLELDINTALGDSEKKIYKVKEAIKIFNELTNQASDITRNGDIA